MVLSLQLQDLPPDGLGLLLPGPVVVVVFGHVLGSML
jgi:hypothetical protein